MKFGHAISILIIIKGDNAMNEIWIEIQGYNGEYLISNLGRVKSLKNNKERILSLKLRRDGYLDVVLSKNGQVKYHQVHRLVAEHFVPGHQEGMVVNHINECKSDNVWTNLEWVTSKENNNHGTAIERRVCTYHSNRNKTVYCTELDMTFKTQAEAARYFGVSGVTIYKVLAGIRNTVKGYHLIFR